MLRVGLAEVLRASCHCMELSRVYSHNGLLDRKLIKFPSGLEVAIRRRYNEASTLKSGYNTSMLGYKVSWL